MCPGTGGLACPPCKRVGAPKTSRRSLFGPKLSVVLAVGIGGRSLVTECCVHGKPPVSVLLDTEACSFLTATGLSVIVAGIGGCRCGAACSIL